MASEGRLGPARRAANAVVEVLLRRENVERMMLVNWFVGSQPDLSRFYWSMNQPPILPTSSSETQRKPSKKLSGKEILLIVAGVALFVVAPIGVWLVHEDLQVSESGVGESTLHRWFAPSPRLTYDQYAQLNAGMTYSQVVQIMGRPGRQVGAGNLVGIVTEAYSWQDPDGGNMMVMFQNGRLIQKNQTGLP